MYWYCQAFSRVETGLWEDFLLPGIKPWLHWCRTKFQKDQNLLKVGNFIGKVPSNQLNCFSSILVLQEIPDARRSAENCIKKHSKQLNIDLFLPNFGRKSLVVCPKF